MWCCAGVVGAAVGGAAVAAGGAAVMGVSSSLSLSPPAEKLNLKAIDSL